jgi:hypothetical protein
MNLSEFNYSLIEVQFNGPDTDELTYDELYLTSLTTVPEPAIGWLIIFGLGTLFRAKWLRKG